MTKKYSINELIKILTKPENKEYEWTFNDVLEEKFVKLFQWQKKVLMDIEKLIERRILFYFNEGGNIGKSKLIQILTRPEISHIFKACIVGASDFKDITYTIKRFYELNKFFPENIIFDVTRADSLSLGSNFASTLENLNNGIIHSTKYKSDTLYFIDKDGKQFYPNVIVFSNAALTNVKKNLTKDKICEYRVWLKKNEINLIMKK